MTLKFLVLILLVGFFASDIIELTYSVVTQSTPDVTITINNNGTRLQEGSLFGDELWYPGKEKNGIIRIHNQYKSIKVSNLGIDVDLKHINKAYGWDEVYDSFIENMRLTITRGKLTAFDKNILKDKSLGELLAISSNESKNGLMLPVEDQFTIRKNDFVDLKYTLLMDKNSGNELQNLTADISFHINLHQNLINDGSGNDNDRDKKKPVIKEPGEDDEELLLIPNDLTPQGTPHWAHNCIVTLLRHGIISGYPDGSIRPDQPITRAESAVLIAKALKIEEENKIFSGYIDPLPKWARGYIIAVSERDIFAGYPMKRFKANRNISREEMVTVLIKGFEKELLADTELSFSDREDIGDWAIEYVKAGVGHQILSGYPDGSFSPKSPITRAEAFTIICKLLGLHDEHM